MGDFNQAIGRGSRAPRGLQLALQEAFEPNLRIVTSDLAFQGRKSIDHIALSTDWAVDSADVISNLHEGRKLSDHFGVAADAVYPSLPVALCLPPGHLRDDFGLIGG